MSAGASTTLTLIVYIDPLSPEGIVITNRAAVGSKATDEVPGNDSDTEETTVELPNYIYDFEHLALGSIMQQDGWTNDLSRAIGGDAAVTNGIGTNLTRVMIMRTNETFFG